ncbi:MAG: PDZ domain-containing protein, partial [Chloroflexi bacterium]|nr:PDZ domain-containing protein [Chloroflexota bacterium]
MAGVWLALALLAAFESFPCVGAEAENRARGFLGIMPREESGWLTIGRIADNSPAKSAGLSGGERILRINARETQGVPFRECAGWLSGPVGEKVILTLVRPGAA